MKTKIYTKAGDSGETSLIGGQRVSKSDPRLEAYGTVDELNSVIGLCMSYINESKNSKLQAIRNTLEKTQHNLFVVGSQLACGDEDWRGQLPSVDKHFAKHLEDQMDQMNESLSELTEFILPGGSLVTSHLHIARTVCRRAERASCQYDTESDTTDIIILLNRLSDYLFVAARYSNWAFEIQDIKWQKSK